jgi:hypothetical protein
MTGMSIYFRLPKSPKRLYISALPEQIGGEDYGTSCPWSRLLGWPKNKRIAGYF